MRESIRMALDELGEPQPDYPTPVANAVEILRDALANWPRRTVDRHPNDRATDRPPTPWAIHSKKKLTS